MERGYYWEQPRSWGREEVHRPSGGSEVGCDSKARNVPMTAEGSRRSWGFPDIGSRKKGKRPHQGGAWTVGSDGVVCVCVCVCVCVHAASVGGPGAGSEQRGRAGKERSRVD